MSLGVGRPASLNRDKLGYLGGSNPARLPGGHAMPFGPMVPTLLKDRIRLWKAGVRDLVMELCCALHNFRVRLIHWQPMV